MIKLLKSTKWWMYLPFACLYRRYMFNWIIEEKDTYNRVIFLYCNVMYTMFVWNYILFLLST